MNTTRIRSYNVIASAALLAAAIGCAALGLAGPASASGGAVLDTPIGVGGCVAAPPNACGKPISLPFTNTAGNAVEVIFTPNPNGDCPNFTVAGNIDGVTPVTFGATQPLAQGNHTINIDASCATGQFTSWGGHLVVDQIEQTGKPKPDADAQPKQGPTVTPDPGIGEVTFHITDRSGVASQCTYSSEGFQSSFGLPANGTFDLDVPAVPKFKNRTGKVTCDNGTSTNTSVFY
jgi:hypothetical protein